MEFTAAPVAVPPTLTIFVQNEVIKLEDLKIPAGIEVTHGDVPTVFHRDNTTIGQALEKEPADRRKELKLRLAPKLDADSQAAADKIEKFLKQRNAAAK